MAKPANGRLVLAACGNEKAHTDCPEGISPDTLPVKFQVKGEGNRLRNDRIKVLSRAVKTINPDGRKLCDYAASFMCGYKVMHYIGIGGLFQIFTSTAPHQKRFITPGMLTDEVSKILADDPNRIFRRLKHARTDDDGTRHPAVFESHCDPLLTLDIDSADVPGWNPFNPEPGVAWVLDQLAFKGASCICQITAGQIPKAGTPARIRLYLLLSEAWSNEEKRNWLKVTARDHAALHLDPAVAGVNQPIYISNPLVISETTPQALYDPWDYQAPDPIPQRWHLLQGQCETVSPEKIKVVELDLHARAALSDVEYAPAGGELQVIRSADGLHQQINSCVWWLVAREGSSYTDGQIAVMVQGRIDELRTGTLAVRVGAARLDVNVLASEIDRSIEGARVKVEGRIDGVPPAFPVTEEVTPATATAQLQTAIDAALNGTGVHAVDAPPGLGKTQQMLHSIIDRDMRADIYVPDHTLAEEIASKIATMGGKGMVIKGRRTPLDDVNRYCKKDKAIELLDGPNGRLASATNLCIRPPRGMSGAPPVDVIARAENICPHFFECEYIRQFTGPPPGTRIVIRAHAYLPTDETLLDEALNAALGKPEAVVVDEDFTGTLINTLKVPVKQFRNSLVFMYRDMVMDGLEAGTLIPTLRDRLAAQDIDVDEEVDSIVKQGRENNQHDNQVNRRRLRPSQTPSAAAAAAIFLRTMQPSHEVFKLVQGSLQAGSDVCNGVWMGQTKKGKPIVCITWTEPPKRLHGAPRVLLLDGTMNTTFLQRMFPRLQDTRITVKRNAEIVQVVDHQISYSWLKRNKDERLRDILGWTAALGAGSPTGACVPKTYEVKFEKTGIPVLHFGKLRGQNTLADCETGIILSRPQPSIEHLESQARALFPELPLQLGHDLEMMPMGYRLDDGTHTGVAAWLHPDPLINQLLISIREAELVQAVDRFRLLHNKECKQVFMLVSQPADLTINKLVRLDELIGPDRLMRALRDACGQWSQGGVLPLSRDWLIKNLPDLFLNQKGKVTPAAAHKFIERVLAWMSRAGRDGVVIIEYRIAGKPGKSRKAIAWSGLQESQVQARLASMAGVETGQIAIREKGHLTGHFQG